MKLVGMRLLLLLAMVVASVTTSASALATTTSILPGYKAVSMGGGSGSKRGAGTSPNCPGMQYPQECRNKDGGFLGCCPGGSTACAGDPKKPGTGLCDTLGGAFCPKDIYTARPARTATLSIIPGSNAVSMGGAKVVKVAQKRGAGTSFNCPNIKFPQECRNEDGFLGCCPAGSTRCAGDPAKPGTGLCVIASNAFCPQG